MSQHAPKLAAALALLLALVACTTSNVATTLQIASAACNLASSEISGLNIPAADKATIVATLNAATQGLTMAATDMQSGQITAAQAVQIAAALLPVVQTNLPASTPAIVKTVISAIAAFLNEIKTAAPQPTATAAGPRAMATTVTYTIPLTRGDRGLISQSLKDLATAQAALAAIH